MAFTMKGVPMMDTSKKHGTNANFGKSGMNDKNGKPVGAGAPGFFGNLMKGKGALGLLNPVGAIASRLGAFGKKKATNAVTNATTTNAPGMTENVDPTMQSPVVPGTNVAPPPPVEEPVVDPNAGVSAAGVPPVA